MAFFEPANPEQREEDNLKQIIILLTQIKEILERQSGGNYPSQEGQAPMM